MSDESIVRALNELEYDNLFQKSGCVVDSITVEFSGVVYFVNVKFTGKVLIPEFVSEQNKASEQRGVLLDVLVSDFLDEHPEFVGNIFQPRTEQKFAFVRFCKPLIDENQKKNKETFINIFKETFEQLLQTGEFGVFDKDNSSMGNLFTGSNIFTLDKLVYYCNFEYHPFQFFTDEQIAVQFIIENKRRNSNNNGSGNNNNSSGISVLKRR